MSIDRKANRKVSSQLAFWINQGWYQRAVGLGLQVCDTVTQQGGGWWHTEDEFLHRRKHVERVSHFILVAFPLKKLDE